MSHQLDKPTSTVVSMRGFMHENASLGFLPSRWYAVRSMDRITKKIVEREVPSMSSQSIARTWPTTYPGEILMSLIPIQGPRLIRAAS